MIDTRFGGWQPSADTRLGRRGNALLVRSVGPDPHLSVEPGGSFAGDVEVMVEARTAHSGTGKIFWSEQGKPFQERWSVVWSVPADNQWHRVLVKLPGNQVTGVRIDPFEGPGDMEIRTIVVQSAKASDRKTWTFRGADIAPDAPEPPKDTWEFLDNGRVRIGVKTSSGAAVGWFSRSGSRNLLNHFDKGRLVQQSWYGDEDGSVWNKQPWRWNPVQGGDWKGNPARILDLKVDKKQLFARSLGRNWAGCDDVRDAIFEETVRLDGDMAHIRFRFRYTGSRRHQSRHQEIPAVFVEPDLDTLVTYTGERPWSGEPLHRSKPGWPNESRKMTENWAAYVGSDGSGIGVLVPQATDLTCYRFGDGKAEHGACSYFAPLLQAAIVPGYDFTYDVYLTIGSAEQIRSRFREIQAGKSTRKSG